MNCNFKLDFEIDSTNWIINPIKKELVKYITENLKLEDKLKINKILKEKYNISWTSSNILLYMCNHLKLNKNNNEYILSIDENLYVPNSEYKLIDIVKLINYGNLELKGTNIVRNALDYISENVNDLLLIKMM